MRGLLASQPALNYLETVLRARFAQVRAAAEGEDREFGASAVEWVVITMIVLVLVGIAAAVIIPAITTKTGAINTCIQNAGGATNSACTP
jgi:phosphotransferase system  glucose/maltose/N-acetylglucosamine-specific IIC component